MRILAGLALRNLLRHPWRSTATVVGVAIGIAAVLATLSVGANVRANLSSTLEAAAGEADLLITPGAGGRAVLEVEPVLSALVGVDGLDALLPVLNYRAEPVRDLAELETSVIPGVDSGFQLSGRLTDRPGAVPGALSAGALPLAGSKGVALGEEFAEVRGYRLGDEVRFATGYGEEAFTVTGLLDEAQGLASTNGGRVGVLALSDLQSIIRLDGRASYLEVHLEPSVAAVDARETLATALGPAYEVSFPAGSGDVASGLVESLQAGLTILAVTLMALGGFMAYNTFMASVVERTREYALLRTVCLTRRDVERLALIEATVVSGLGVVVGLALGVLLAWGMTGLNAFYLGFELRTLVIPVRNVLVASGIGAAVALFAGYLPARSAGATPPIQAARAADSAEPPRSAPIGWALIALAVLATRLPWEGVWAVVAAGGAMALFFIGVVLAASSLLPVALAVYRPLLSRLFGNAGRLGADFTSRNPARNGVAIGTVIVGTGLIVGVGAMVAGINRAIADWVDTTIVGDLFVTSPASFPPDFESLAAEVPGIDVVSGVAIRVVRFQPEGAPRGRSVALVLVDPERFDPRDGFGRFQYIQGQGDDQAGYAALRRGGEVLAANTLLDRFGVEAGESVSLRTADGFVTFPVSGVVVDFTGGGEAFIGSLDDAELFGGGTPDLFVMTVDEGVAPAEARDRLNAAFPDLYLDVTLNQTYRQRVLTLARQSFASTNLLLVLAVLIAALGVANTLGMNLSTRQHEVAVLRALGLTRRGVRTMVAAEGMVILTLGAGLGVGFGLLLADVITAGAGALTGFLIAPDYPWRLVLLALATAPLVGLAASLLPARRAARLSPVLALGAAE